MQQRGADDGARESFEAFAANLGKVAARTSWRQ